MASSNDSIKQTLLIALSLCVVCSILVSGAAVILKPAQDANKLLDRNKNILSAAGLFDPEVHSDADVAQLFAQFTPRIVDLEQGRLLSEAETDQLGIDLSTYDPRRAVNDPRYSRALSAAQDVANIKRQLLYPMVYVVGSEDDVEQIVLPINGYGLWGILYGFLALEGDGNTVDGIGFYELKETPGLGAEVTNPRWRNQWPGKKIYAASGDVALDVVRGSGSGPSQISGLAGATLTSRGVENLIQFWMGENGFGPFLQNLRNS
ncbi:MAG: Na(+)-translocating NADH-quinone reductase subunit C [Gammaproteobacteria bacterium]|nr:Na(+)-translocating NADH-quinone reductase subunit C [Pseudomonadales bacterium]MCP5346027.1 Na(+)-translocating NADH-quinone reductase subunit C [Pseudomonadales bacterium]